MSEILEKDKTARDRIKNEIYTNFFVEAGAGSGKTFSLVERMVSMVENGIDVRKICAITFTKAAAGEFYSRFHKRLIERSKEDNITPEGRKNIENATKNIDLCFLGTIDSFCNMIISEQPNIAGVPSDSKVKTAEEMQGIYIREYSKIIDGEYGEELKEKYRKCAAFNYNTKELFSHSVDILSQIRNTETVYNVSNIPLDKTFSDYKTALINLFNLIKEDETSVYIPTRKNSDQQKFINLFNEISSKGYLLTGKWDKYPSGVKSLLKKFSTMKLAPNCKFAEMYPDYCPPHFTNNKLTWYDIKIGPDNYVINTLEEIKYSYTIDFIRSAVDAICDKLCREGSLQFFDYLYYLRNMLKKDAEGDGKLIKHIYDRHSYFLIDEFQDTNPMQAEIFFYLTAKEPVANWRNCVPKPGSIFIVGDPKQSIYRFKSADVASFLSVRSLFKGEVGEVLSLSRNFRSTKEICDWFNEKFSILLPEDTDNQAKYELIPSEENDNPVDCFGGVYYYKSSMAKGGHSLDVNLDAEKVAGIISNLVNNPHRLIKGKGDKSPRKIEYRDFMIITPSKSKIKEYISVLREYNIPVRAEGSVSFDNCQALRAISEIYTAVANPTDKQAVYGALTGIFFAISKNEVLEFIQAGGELNLYSKNDIIGCEKIRDILSVLRPVAYKAAEQSPVTTFSMLQTELRIFEKTGTDFLECYYYAIELLREAESTNAISSLKEAADLVADIADNNVDQERCISLNESENRVYIANLHKVKGLEAPIVILAYPYAKKHNANHRVDVINNKNWIFEISSKNSDSGSLFSTDSFPEELELENECLQDEKIRLLYVAATRARSALIICISHMFEKDVIYAGNPWKNLAFANEDAGSFNDIEVEESDADRVPKYNDIPDKISATELYASSTDNILAGSSLIEKTYEIIRPSSLTIKAKTSSEEEFEDTDVNTADNARHREDAALIGTIVHRMMELTVISGDRLSKGKMINEIISDFGLTDNKYSEILCGVYDTVHNGGFEQNNGMIKDILPELLSAEEVYCEVPFCSKNTDNGMVSIRNGVMDAVYRKNGKWHIVDYKTNADASDLDEKYKAQLDEYISAFRTMTGNNADALIYHIDV